MMAMLSYPWFLLVIAIAVLLNLGVWPDKAARAKRKAERESVMNDELEE